MENLKDKELISLGMVQIKSLTDGLPKENVINYDENKRHLIDFSKLSNLS